MAKKIEKFNPGSPTSPKGPTCPTVIRLPFAELPEGVYPTHPRNLELSLSPGRRRKLQAIFAGLQASGARVMVGRGGSPVEMPVSRLTDVIYYLLDHAEQAVPAVPAVPAVSGESCESDEK